MDTDYFVAHGMDVDGIACHAMGLIKLEPVHFFVDHPTIVAQLKKIKQTDPITIIRG